MSIKKIVIATTVAIAALSLSACETDVIHEVEEVPSGINGGKECLIIKTSYYHGGELDLWSDKKVRKVYCVTAVKLDQETKE